MAESVSEQPRRTAGIAQQEAFDHIIKNLLIQIPAERHPSLKHAFNEVGNLFTRLYTHLARVRSDPSEKEEFMQSNGLDLRSLRNLIQVNNIWQVSCVESRGSTLVAVADWILKLDNDAFSEYSCFDHVYGPLFTKDDILASVSTPDPKSTLILPSSDKESPPVSVDLTSFVKEKDSFYLESIDPSAISSWYSVFRNRLVQCGINLLPWHQISIDSGVSALSTNTLFVQKRKDQDESLHGVLNMVCVHDHLKMIVSLYSNPPQGFECLREILQLSHSALHNAEIAISAMNQPVMKIDTTLHQYAKDLIYFFNNHAVKDRVYSPYEKSIIMISGLSSSYPNDYLLDVQKFHTRQNELPKHLHMEHLLTKLTQVAAPVASRARSDA